jgi:hypothetical protein
MLKGIVAIALFLPALILGSELKGNLNLNYQSRDPGSNNPTSSVFGQVVNFYINDRIFYNNDLTLGAYIFHNKASDRERGDFRVRYNMNMAGFYYTLYSTYSPYTLYYSNAPSQRVRIFQTSLNIMPKIIPDISTSYMSTKQYTTDKPVSKSGTVSSWNIGTQISKVFGTIRGVFQRQTTRSDAPLSQKQNLSTINVGYDVAREIPLNIFWTAGYNYSGTKTVNDAQFTDKSHTHVGSLQVSRGFSRWLTLAAAGSGRFADFERTMSSKTKIEDLFSTVSANLALRRNISLMFLRGYSISRSENETTTRIINDYVNLGGTLRFDISPNATGRLSISRSIYFASILGKTNVDNATLIIDAEIYRRTTASINLGVAHNDRAPSGLGKYQMIRNFTIVSRPVELMTFNINYESSLSSINVNFVNSSSDNLSVNMTHSLKPYFNYTLTYSRSKYYSTKSSVLTTFSGALNYRLSNSLSLLGTYSRRDLGDTPGVLQGRIDNIISGRITWLITRNSSLTANYTITNMNTSRQAQSYGGYYALSF